MRNKPTQEYLKWKDNVNAVLDSMYIIFLYTIGIFTGYIVGVA